MGPTQVPDAPGGDPPAPDTDDVPEAGPRRQQRSGWPVSLPELSRGTVIRAPIEARSRKPPGGLTRKKLHEWVVEQDPSLGNGGSSPLPQTIEDRNQWVELAFHVVKTKLLRHPAYGAGSGIPQHILTTSAEIFSSAEDLREDFLQTEYEAHVVSDEAIARRKAIMDKFLAETAHLEPKEEEEEEEEGEGEGEEGVAAAAAAAVDEFQADKLNVKLILTDIAQASRMRTFRSILSPILSKFDLLPELGMFHAALMVGPWLIDWNNSSLCLPRKVESRNVIAAVDMPPIEGRDNVDTALSKIAIVIAHWNSRMIYMDRPGKSEANWQGNCQDFVYDLLLELGFPTTFPGLVGDFVKSLKTHGSSALTYYPSPVVRTDFNLVSSVTFNSHAELDEFVNTKIVSIEEFFETRPQYVDDWLLLKSFDRAFWLKYRKFLRMPTTAPGQARGLALSRPFGDPTKGSRAMGCPFKDPTETGSVILTDKGLQG